MKWKQKIRYSFDQFISKGTFSLILMLFLVTFISVVIIGLIAFAVSGGNADALETIWISFMQTLDAGNLSNVSGSFWYVLMMVFATIIGLFITSLLISFISNGFQNKLENLSKGTSQIVETKHTLILGWNDDVPVIISELLKSNMNVRHPVIVILSEEDSIKVHDTLKTLLKSFQNTKIVIRTGSVFDCANLEMCAIGNAKSIIISGVNDASTIKTLLSIRQTSFFKPDNKGYITAIFADYKNLKIAQDICGDKIEIIHQANSMARIMAQTCLQPGLSFVYEDLFDFSGDEFYFYANNELVGKTVADIINKFNKSAFVGIYRDGKSLINPLKEEVILPDDKLILISEDDDTILLDGTPTNQYQDKMTNIDHFQSKSKRNILSIGCNENTMQVIKEMLPFVRKGTHITFLTAKELDSKCVNDLKNDDLIELELIYGTTYDRATLEKIDYTHIDSIMVFSNDTIDGEKSDSETLLTVLIIKEIIKEKNLDISIIIEIEKNKNEPVMKYISIDDFIIGNVISNKMLCQIAENRHLNKIFGELLSDEGSEIYLKDAKKYVSLHNEVDFYTVVESALHKNETAIGYKIKSLKEKGIIINPKKDEKISFSEGDCIIVLAQD